MKVVINTCHGGYSLSKQAYEYLGLAWDNYGFAYIEAEDRANENLVKCIEELGPMANGRWAQLKVVEVPDDVRWTLEDFDGIESIEEVHRSWN